MSYNGLDTRLSRTENGATVDFRRSGPGVTDPLLSDSGATYTPGVSERRGSTTTYQHSGLKNATTQTGTAQTVTASRKYDAFGQVLGSTGTWQGPFGYAGGFGYQSSDRSGLQLLGHRYYDPSEGRFITNDPIKSGRNWTAYAGGNPISQSDQSGLMIVPMLKLAMDNMNNGPENQPASVSLDENVQYAEMLGISYRRLANWSLTLSLIPLNEFYDLVKAGGMWDFKLRKPGLKVAGRPIFEHYGNWHFGVVANAFGFGEDFALRMAGRAQKGSTFLDWLLGKPPYGDDDVDQYWIKKGYEYYDKRYGGVSFVEEYCR